ncbi:MAG TPA: SDR family oxidoreductase [Tepidisphaeraceae bacterium]|nr:SDR family oxidoreductase [Tepidisphaeraceae bacterium]
MDKHRAALITGGAKRVGAAIARRLAQEGFDIAITYLASEKEAQSLLQEIQTLGRKAIAFHGDIDSVEKWAPAMAQRIDQEFGRLDLLVNNASLYKPGGLTDTNADMVRQMMNIHFWGPLVLSRTFEKMLRISHGAIINMVDAMVEKPMTNFLAYSASKAALGNLTLALARELAPQVRVNGIAPGVVEWPPDFPADQRQAYLKRVPLQRAGTPQDVAEMVVYLATTGQYITGQILKLDGGRSIA